MRSDIFTTSQRVAGFGLSPGIIENMVWRTTAPERKHLSHGGGGKERRIRDRKCVKSVDQPYYNLKILHKFHAPLGFHQLHLALSELISLISEIG